MKINGIVDKVLRTYCDKETFFFSSLLRSACDVKIAGESWKEGKKIEQESFLIEI